jgi:NAD+ diphosphatase
MADRGRELDRAAHLRKDLDFLERTLEAEGTLLVPVWRELHVVRGERLVLPNARAAARLLDAGGELVWLGMLAGKACFAIDIDALPDPLVEPSLGPGAELIDLRLSAARLPAEDTELAFYARALLLWHARHRFCGRCGAPTRPRDGGHLRLCTRGECGLEHFPRTDPCVLVLVTDGEHCLLGRQREWPAGMYSALAGFVEPSETIEQAAAREVLEEAGVRISALRYAGSQPWPFPASLMLGFMARAESRKLTLDGAELEDARWVPRGQLLCAPRPDFFVPGTHTLSGQLIAAFARGDSELGNRTTTTPENP